MSSALGFRRPPVSRTLVALIAGLLAIGTQAPPVAAVILPPSITKSFGATYLPINGVSSLSFTISNPNGFSDTDIGFTDTFPTGLVQDLGGSPINTCGGTLSGNGSSITLSGGSITAHGSCSITDYAVKDTAYGKADNSVTVTNGTTTGNTSTASLIVAHPPTAAVNFIGASNAVTWATAGTTLKLDVGVENPNTFTTLSGVGFTATLPAGLTIASPNGLVVSGACTAAEISAVAGSHSLSMSGVTFAENNGDPVNPDPDQGCGFDVNVVTSGNGLQSFSTGPLTATETHLTPGAAATAALSVVGSGARIYWGTTAFQAGLVQFARLDGSVGATLKLSGLGGGYEGTAIDAAAGRVYGADAGLTAIQWETLDDATHGSVSMIGAGSGQPAGLAINPAAGRLYWASPTGQAISYAAYKAGTAGVLYSSGDGDGATISNPSGVAVDPGSNRIYWTNEAGAHGISYANLDGSGSGHDLATGNATVSSPKGLVIDAADGLVFWANLGANKISYAHVNGSGGGDLDTTGATVQSPVGLAFDPTTRRLWWGNQSSGFSLASVMLDATGTVASGGLTLTTPGVTPAAPSFPSILYPPKSSAAPTLTGSGKPSTQMSCSKGTWAGDVLGDAFYRVPHSYSYKWQNDGTTISGATSSTYTPTVVGDYSCTVTATNAAGSTTAKSNVADSRPPTVSSLAVAPASGSTIGTTIPVKLTWSAADAGAAASGIAHYEVSLSTNAGAYAVVSTPTTASYTRSLAPSGTTTYRYRVRAFDKAGNASAYVYTATFKVALAQQTSTAATYGGTWATVTTTSASGGSYKYASATGASVSYTFTGRAIGVVATLGTAFGSFNVYLDGTLVATVSDNATSTIYRRLVFSKAWSTAATHTIKLTCLGTSGHPRISIDAFAVLD